MHQDFFSEINERYESFYDEIELYRTCLDADIMPVELTKSMSKRELFLMFQVITLQNVIDRNNEV